MSAAVTDYRIFIDADHDTATGCTVASMAGVDHVLTTRVETTDSAGMVTRTYRRACEAGSLGSEIELGNGWDAGFQAASGQMLVETSMPFAAFGSTLPRNMRIGVEAQQGSAIHQALSLPGGGPALFPIPAQHRRAVGAPGSVRVITLDGTGADWNGLKSLFDGIAASGAAGLRMIKVFAFADVATDTLYFRIDANLSTDAPYATDDEYLRTQGEPQLSVPAPGVLANDGDPNGQPLTATPVSPAAHGTVTLNPDGSFTYTPNDPTSSQADVFEYRASNGAKVSNAAQVRIAVTSGSATSPEAVDDAYGTNEDTALNVAAPGVLANDSDPNSDPLTAALLSSPAHGTVVLNAAGGFTYTPAKNYFGSDSFSYTVTDGTETDTATVTITIASVNDAPRVDAATFTIPENSPAGTLVGAVSVSDVDTADDHVFAIISGNTGNAFAINPSNGRITVLTSAAVNFETTPQFLLTVRASDDGSPSRNDTATITINLTDVNEAPVAAADAYAIDEDTPLNVAAPGVLANDADPDGDTITATLVAGVTNGTLALNPDGSFSYSANPHFNGTDSFTYRLNDGALDSNVATVTITVNPVNDTPVFATGGDVATDEDVAFTAPWATGISAGPANEAGQVLTFTVTGNTNPTLFAIAPAVDAAGVLSFTPAANANGTASITVTLSDDGGGANTTAPVTFTIAVNAVNDAPVNTVVASAVTDEDTPLVFNDANANRISIADVDAGAASVEVTLSAANGVITLGSTAGLTMTSGANGTAAMTFTGSVAAINAAMSTVTFAPTPDFGGPASLTIVTNDLGNTPAPAAADTDTITITVNAINDLPVATPDAYPLNEGATLSEPAPGVLSNDSDVEGPMTAVKVTDPLFGTVTLNADGSFVYTHDGSENFSDSFTYKVNDGITDSATVTVTFTITPVNDAPVAADDAFATDEDTPLTVTLPATVLANDTDGEGSALTAIVATNPSSGTLTLNADGTFTYTPNPDFNGTDTFTYVANDGTVDSAPATVTITVNAINDEPSFAIGTAPSSNEDAGAQTFTNVITGLSPGPANESTQTLTFNLFQTLATDGLTFSVAPAIAPDGTLTYTSAANKSGTATYEVYVTDSGSGTAPNDNRSATLTFTITVNAVNDAPVQVVPSGITTTEDTPVAVPGISVSDVDAMGGAAEMTLTAANGTLTLGDTTGLNFTVGDGTADTTMTFWAGIDTVNLRVATLSYTPAVDFAGTETITVTTNDQGNMPPPVQQDSDVFTISVTAVNDPPVNNLPAPQSVNEDAALVFTGANAITIGDVDAGTGTLVTELTAVNGTLTAAAGAVITNNGTANITLTGTLAQINASLDGLTFTPTAEYVGNATIAFNTNDGGNTGSGGALSDSGDILTITVINVNDPPINTVPATQTVDEDSVDNAISGVSVADIDAGPSVQVTLSVTNGTLSLTSVVGLSFTTGDGNDDTTMTFSGGLENVNNRLAGLTFTPDANFFGTAQITVLSDDLGGETDSDTFDVTVAPINDAPTFTIAADPAASNEDAGPQTVAGFATSISQGPGETADTLTFNVTSSGVPTGTLTFATAPSIDPITGVLTYEATADTNGTASFSVTLQDSGSNVAPNVNVSSPAQFFTITVNDVNDAPTFTLTASTTSTEDDGAVSVPNFAGSISSGPSDESAQGLTMTATIASADATLTFSVAPSVNVVTGALTYTASPNAFGTATIDVVLTDTGSNVAPNSNTSATQSFTITVDPINDEPTFTIAADPAASNEDAGAQSVSNFATLISQGPNESGQALTFTVTQTGGTLTFATAPAIDETTGELTYTASADVFGTATFDVVLTDDGSNISPNDNTSITDSFTITVNNVNDAPVVTASAGTTAFTEDLGAVVVDGAVTVTDIDDGNIESATITISNLLDAGLETLSAPTLLGAATASYVAPTLTLSGTATLAQYQAMLAAVTYVNTSQNPDATDRVIQFVVNDGDVNSGASSKTVAITAVNDAPVITSGNSFSVPENTTAVVTVTTTDSESDTVTYTLTGGADQGDFAIDLNTGSLTFNPAPNFEAPADSDVNNIYIVEVTATDGTDAVAQTITVTVTNVDEAPVFTSTATPSLLENTTAVVTVQATDPESLTITYSITGGADQALFTIDTNTGALSFLSAPDFEAPADAGANNVYDVQVTATEGTMPAVQNIAVTVLNGPEPPVFTSSATPSAAENQTVVLTVTTTDADLDTVTYSISGGADQALFAIDTNTGALSFVSAPDFESPADAGANNVYDVQVQANDGTFTVQQNIAVTVTNVDEVPSITSSDTVSVPENTVVAITVTATDPDTPPASLVFSISGGADSAAFSIDAGTGVLSFSPAPDFENPTDADTNNVYVVEVSVTDGTTPVAQTITITVTNVNEGPQITSANAANYDENDTAVVLTVAATDPESDTVTYAFTGGADTGDLSIDSNSGAITFNASPNFEAPADSDSNNTYVVEVTATSTGGTDVQTITITVVDVNEQPVITSGAPANVAENTAGTVHTVTATDPDGTLPTFSISGGADAADFNINATTGALSFAATPNFEAPADANADNVYEITVRATDGTLFDEEVYTVTVTNVNEAPVADDETYTRIIGNTQHRVDGGAGSTTGTVAFHSHASDENPFIGDDDPDNDVAFGTISIVPVTDAATANGGKITLAADGKFTYTPPPGVLGATADHYDYTLTDGTLTDVGRLNFTISKMVWYVKNDDVTGPFLGTSTDPFNELSDGGADALPDDAEDASAAGSTVFVFAGNGTSTGMSSGFVMDHNQSLLGEPNGLIVDIDDGGPEVAVTLVTANPANRPVIANAGGSAVSVIATADRNVAIRGFRMSGGDNGVDATSSGAAVMSVTIDDVIVTGAANEGIDINQGSTATTSVALLANLNVTSNGNGIDVRRTAGSLRVQTFNNITVGGGTLGTGVLMDTVNFDTDTDVAVDTVPGGTLLVGSSGDGVGAAGVLLQNVTGGVSFTDADVFASNGTALLVSGFTPFGLVVTGSTATLQSTNGAAADLSNVAASMPGVLLSSTNSVSRGLSLTATTGTITALSGSAISNATGTDYYVSGGSVSTAFPGGITDDLGQLMRIVDNSGAHSFTGAITDNDDTDGGIGGEGSVHLDNNDGGTITFSGGLLLSTSANQALRVTNGGTVNICAVNPCGGATSVVNKLTTTSGVPLRFENTNFGTSGLTFRSIASNGAASGIIINTTGPNGGLTVTGTGVDDSGGSITNSTADAISLISTRNISLTQMNIATTTQSHIDAATVTGLTLNSVETDLSTDHGIKGNMLTNFVATNCTFDRGGAGSGLANVDGVNIINLRGTSSVTGTTFMRSNTRQFYVVNNTATVAAPAEPTDVLTVSNNDWNTHTGPFAGDHLSVSADTGGNFKLIVDATGGANNFTTGGIGVQATSAGSGTMKALITGVNADGPMTAGVVIGATASGNTKFDIFGNKAANGTGFSGMGSLSIAVTCITSGTCNGFIRDNSINHTAGPGVDAFHVILQGNGTLNAEVSNNVVSGNFQRGFNAESGAGSGSNARVNLKFNNNTITSTASGASGALQGVNIQTGVSSGGPDNKMCLDMFSNSVTMVDTTAYRLRNEVSAGTCPNCVFELKNYAGGATDTVAIASWITNPPNSNTHSTASGVPISIGTNNPYTTTGGCTAPTL